jgi:hypothetical protein
MNPAWETLNALGLTNGEGGASRHVLETSLKVLAEDLNLLSSAAQEEAEHLVGPILRMSHRAKLLAELAREKAEATP